MIKIKDLREKKKMKQGDIAKKLDLDRSTIAKWETGESLPRADKIPLLASILGCSIDELFEQERGDLYAERAGGDA